MFCRVPGPTTLLFPIDVCLNQLFNILQMPAIVSVEHGSQLWWPRFSDGLGSCRGRPWHSAHSPCTLHLALSSRPDARLAFLIDLI